jgi:hypothetical protein
LNAEYHLAKQWRATATLNRPMSSFWQSLKYPARLNFAIHSAKKTPKTRFPIREPRRLMRVLTAVLAVNREFHRLNKDRIKHLRVVCSVARTLRWRRSI